MKNQILTKAQAKAVYDAMRALNNVSGASWHRLPIGNGGEWADVREDDEGGVHIGKGPLHRFDVRESVVIIIGPVEYHESQSAFATAYGVAAWSTTHSHTFTSTNAAGDGMRIVVTCDFRAIAARLAPRARKSKSGTAEALYGAVIVERLPVPVAEGGTV